MFGSIAEKITTQLELNNAIKSEDRAIYRYGIQQGLSIILNLITTLLIGILTGMFWESMIFTAAYMFLRRYAGGFHAKTPVRCYLYSTTMVVAVLLAIKLLPMTKIVYFCLFVVGVLAIFIFAPVEDKHKPLDETEQCVYRKRTRLVLALQCFAFVFSMIFQFKPFYSTISAAVFCLGFLVLMGKVKNVLQEQNPKE